MKKILLTLIIVSSLLVTGCGNKDEEEFDKLAQEYFEDYMSGVTNIDNADISLEALNKVKDVRGYDLKRFEDCDIKSKVTYTLKDGKVTKKVFDLKCD